MLVKSLFMNAQAAVMPQLHLACNAPPVVHPNNNAKFPARQIQFVFSTNSEARNDRPLYLAWFVGPVCRWMFGQTKADIEIMTDHIIAGDQHMLHGFLHPDQVTNFMQRQDHIAL